MTIWEFPHVIILNNMQQEVAEKMENECAETEDEARQEQLNKELVLRLIDRFYPPGAPHKPIAIQ